MIRSKLFRRVLWVVLLLVAANSGAFYLLSVPLIANATYRQEEEAARNVLNSALRTFLYGQNDYVWVADYDARLISHPDPKLHGADFSRRTDIHGNLIWARTNPSPSSPTLATSSRGHADQHMIIHPNPQLEGTNIATMIEHERADAAGAHTDHFPGDSDGVVGVEHGAGSVVAPAHRGALEHG
ncbi:MAG: cache domain-containing protein [Myxococcota bacterium]